VQVSFNKGAQTLHTRHVSTVVMRAGIVGDHVDPISIGRHVIPTFPGSPSVSPWLIASYAIHPKVDLITYPALASREESGPRPPRLSECRGQADRTPVTGRRRPSGSGLLRAGQWLQSTSGPAAARAKAAAAGG
jgi:hypothetical protein